MDIAIVTGAGSGLGLAITRKLIELGLRVYGLGGQYDDARFDHECFVPMPCNMGDMGDVRAKVAEIIKREGDNIYVLVNNAKLYHHKSFEETSDEEMEAAMKVNLLSPLVITRMALPSLNRLGGFIINIVANTAENARGGAMGAASAGGLRWMGEALFEQLRENGVKVSNVFPQTNRWRPDGSVPAQQRPQSGIDTEAVAEAVGSIVLNRFNNVVTDIVIRPQRLSEKPIPVPFNVPYPKPKPLPKTAPRETEEHVSLAETRAEMRKENEDVRQLRGREDVGAEEAEDMDEDVRPSEERGARRGRVDGRRRDADREEFVADRDFDDRAIREEDDDEEHPYREDAGEDIEEGEDREMQPEGRRDDRQNDFNGSDQLTRRRHRRGRRGGRNRNLGDRDAQPLTENRSSDGTLPVAGEDRPTQNGEPRREDRPYRDDRQPRFDRRDDRGNRSRRDDRPVRDERMPRDDRRDDERPARIERQPLNGEPRREDRPYRDDRQPRAERRDDRGNRPRRDDRQPRDERGYNNRYDRPAAKSEKTEESPNAREVEASLPVAPVDEVVKSDTSRPSSRNERDERFERDTRPSRREHEAREVTASEEHPAEASSNEDRPREDRRPDRSREGRRPDRFEDRRDESPRRENREETIPEREEVPVRAEAVSGELPREERPAKVPMRMEAKPPVIQVARPQPYVPTGEAARRNRRNRKLGSSILAASTILGGAAKSLLPVKPITPVPARSPSRSAAAPARTERPASKNAETPVRDTKPSSRAPENKAPAKEPETDKKPAASKVAEAPASAKATTETPKPKRAPRKPRAAKTETTSAKATAKSATADEAAPAKPKRAPRKTTTSRAKKPAKAKAAETPAE